MNKKLGLAVAGALVAFASTANAGITIPAGDWTVDIGGNVNAFYTHTSYSGDAGTLGATKENTNTIQTGLLPAALGIGAKTRQNDMDVAVQFSFFTGVNANGADNLNGATNGGNGGLGYNSLNIRQAFLTFGDASWGQIKLGRDLGVFGSDAILSDMTLLGVGSGAGGANSSTLGRIGSGYLYADWQAQIQYQTPNWNGFQVTAALREGLGQLDNSNLGYDGKATYDFAANDVTGRVWVGGIFQKIQVGTAATSSTNAVVNAEYDAKAWEIGAKAAYQGAELVGYYYNGQNMDSGIGTFLNTVSSTSSPSTLTETDNSGGYVQATYKLPTIGTKLGASWGTSLIKTPGAATEAEREAWIVGAYHPLTKSVNLVAEYNHLNITASDKKESEAKTVSLGAILFF